MIWYIHWITLNRRRLADSARRRLFLIMGVTGLVMKLLASHESLYFILAIFKNEGRITLYVAWVPSVVVTLRQYQTSPHKNVHKRVCNDTVIELCLISLELYKFITRPVPSVICHWLRKNLLLLMSNSVRVPLLSLQKGQQNEQVCFTAWNSSSPWYQ